MITSADISSEGLDALHVNARRDGIYSEAGNITLKNVSGAIVAGEVCAAWKGGRPTAVITVDGNDEMGEEIGPDFAVGGENTQEG